MADPRCNCGEADCPICNAPEHRPWQPKPGTSPDPLEVENAHLRHAVEVLGGQLQANRAAMVRRYVLVLLLSLLGGMIGGVASALTVLHYH